MIIVSQDKMSIYNFNNVNLIKVIDDGRIISFDNTYQYNSGVIGDLLGQYKTEERAKEVLHEIIDRYTNWENLKAGQPDGICSPKYEMPKE